MSFVLWIKKYWAYVVFGFTLVTLGVAWLVISGRHITTRHFSPAAIGRRCRPIAAGEKTSSLRLPGVTPASLEARWLTPGYPLPPLRG